MAVNSKEASRDIPDDKQQSSSCYSCRCQHKINAQAAEIANMNTELDHDLEENWKFKGMFNLEWLVEAISKVVTNITMKNGP